MKSKPQHQNFFAMAENSLPEHRVKEAKEEAQKEILKIRLSDLRKQFGIKQTDIQNFSQPAVSKLEARKDMKISTLIEYVHSLGLTLEIKVKENKEGRKKVITLLEG